MRAALTVALTAALVVHALSHVAIFVGLLRQRDYRRALSGFVCSPLGALFAWEANMKPLARVWLASLAIYAGCVLVVRVG